MLFVSGERAERFPKAMAAGADLVCIDLEDAVHPERKADARAQVVAWLASRSRQADEVSEPQTAVRINGLKTGHGLRDVLALVDAGVRVDWLIAPKTEAAAELEALDAWLGGACGAIAALVETPLGLERAYDIARAQGRLGALMLGGADLAAETGARFDWEGLRFARGRLLNAAKAAGLQAWDVPHVDLSNDAGLADETARALALGYDCKTAIHPQQIATIHRAFEPSESERAWADALLAAVPPGTGSGAFLFQGKMVDAPIIKRARRIAALATRSH